MLARSLMETSWSGAAGAGEGARGLLRKRLEAGRTAGAKSPPGGGGGFVRAALAVCFLLVPAVLLLQRWQAGPAPEWVFGADLPPEVNRGMCVSVCARVSSWPFILCLLIWLLYKSVDYAGITLA